ncbi:endolytic transglycosylase MltG [Streptomyces sp. JJ36]|uniref:endolytic transglycosylase MltG n=1 Tax=Streptomyces sp. JJ36 TaxID=2736645 RepID=UPI001EFFD118|nr:endolytic transglycosylase MltG [Streptomyces sp. JJ36]MCF6523888.1 endolytic transglycosylase MltG [Streptomyces sp. JJ36]
MTDYGRGPGSHPWHPEDPLYGDHTYPGGQTGARQEGWAPYAEGYQDPYGGAYADPYAGQQQYGQQYGQEYGQEYGQQQYGQGYGPEQDASYGQAGHGQPYAPGQDPYAQDPYATGSWDTGSWDVSGQQPQGPQDFGGAGPYGAPPAGAYGAGPQQQAQQGAGSHPGGPGHPAQRQSQQGGGHAPGPGAAQGTGPGAGPGGAGSGRPQDGPDPETGWDPGPDQGESAFFRDDDGDDRSDRGDRDGPDDDPYEPAGRRAGRTRRGGTKRRNGCACLTVLLVLGGGLATAGYFGVQFYNEHFGAPPDYSGEGHGEVQVTIPEGSTHSDIGNILKKAGVVKSHDAFVAAAGANEKALGIHAGVYSLHKEMSAEAAVEMMLDPASQGGLIVPEGRRARQIYALIDEALEEKKGTTQKAAKSADLGLPSWAKGDPEGFLFPAKYPAGKDSTPEEVLRAMVDRAKAEYRKLNLESEAKKAGRTPREMVTIASLIQAEAQEDADFGKVSRVIYNRLEKPMKLQFDSTINYAKGESELNTSVEDTKFDSPYNTYLHRGLPPGPIDNPGLKAMRAALEPTEGDWLYFVSVKPGDTRFTASHEEHLENVRDFNAYQRKKREEDG